VNTNTLRKARQAELEHAIELLLKPRETVGSDLNGHPFGAQSLRRQFRGRNVRQGHDRCPARRAHRLCDACLRLAPRLPQQHLDIHGRCLLIDSPRRPRPASWHTNSPLQMLGWARGDQLRRIGGKRIEQRADVFRHDGGSSWRRLDQRCRRPQFNLFLQRRHERRRALLSHPGRGSVIPTPTAFAATHG
jgi:hypothetical protein